MTDFPLLLSSTLRNCIDPGAEVISSHELPMSGTGYSGAALRRYAVQYQASDGERVQVELVVKAASLTERRVMVHLYRQARAARPPAGHPAPAAGVPFCHTLDSETMDRAALCMEYIAEEWGEGNTDLNCAAAALAALHARNLGNSTLLGWLPPADGAFAQTGYVLGGFRAAWERAMKDADFAREYGHRQDALYSAGERFASFVEETWQAGSSLTLIHGDLHDGNLLVRAGQPYFLDWEHARYGSLYLDLPNLLEGESLRAYYAALREAGVRIDEPQFYQNYREAGRYVGFKYMGFMLAQWDRRDEPGVRSGLENLIELALNGGNF